MSMSWTRSLPRVFVLDPEETEETKKLLDATTRKCLIQRTKCVHKGLGTALSRSWLLDRHSDPRALHRPSRQRGHRAS
jgi:hypothetical protein